MRYAACTDALTCYKPWEMCPCYKQLALQCACEALHINEGAQRTQHSGTDPRLQSSLPVSRLSFALRSMVGQPVS